MTELILAVSLAVVISAGCSLFEAVLYSIPLRHIETLARRGKKSGRILKVLRSDIENPIAAIISLNTIANTAGAAVAGAAVTAIYGHKSLWIFSIFFTLIILVFSEVVPKTAGVYYAKTFSGFVAYPIYILTKIMTPAVWLCSHITRLVARNASEESVSSEELKTMAGLSLKTGGIKHLQKSVIENILSLDSKIVKDVMTPRTVIFSLSEHLTLEDISKQFTTWEHSRFPVYDEDSEDIVGVVLTKEMLSMLSEGKKDISLTEIMRPANFIAETARLNTVLMDFIGSRSKLFMVIDEYGGLSGIITLEDILEEILGREIIDESDLVTDKRKLARDRRNKLVSELSS